MLFEVAVPPRCKDEKEKVEGEQVFTLAWTSGSWQ